MNSGIEPIINGADDSSLFLGDIMIATSDETALYASIRANPHEDTPRLMYADWLDERGGPGDAERAELIRVQIKAALIRADFQHGVAEANKKLPRNMQVAGVLMSPELDALDARTKHLLAALDATRPTCPACGGYGIANYGTLGADSCYHCGDLRAGKDGTGRIGTFTRGLIEEVTVPNLAAVLHLTYKDCPKCNGTGDDGHNPRECPTCHGNTRIPGDYVPTTWATNLLATHPGVRLVRVTDRVPFYGAMNDYGWWEPANPEDVSSYVVPKFIFETLWNLFPDQRQCGDSLGRWMMGWGTIPAANRALAEAVAGVLHEMCNKVKE